VLALKSLDIIKVQLNIKNSVENINQNNQIDQKEE
jgi:hypothetical protein